MISRHTKEEPRSSCTEEDLSIFPLAIMVEEVLHGSFGDLKGFLSLGHGSGTPDLIWVALGLAVHICVDVVASLLNVTGDVESVAGSLGDGESVVESDAAGNSTKSAIRQVREAWTRLD